MASTATRTATQYDDETSSEFSRPSAALHLSEVSSRVPQTIGIDTAVLLSSFKKPSGKPFHRYHAKQTTHRMKPIAWHRPPPSTWQKCKEPLKLLDAQQVAALDPTGARTRLFDPHNEDAIRVGDVVLVRQRQGEPFAGVLMNIRRRGPHTGILLRGMATRVGVEMWFKIYSPTVQGIELVRKRERRARRARLTYLREGKHDVAPQIEGWLRQYLRDGVVRGGEKEPRRGESGAWKTI